MPQENKLDEKTENIQTQKSEQQTEQKDLKLNQPNSQSTDVPNFNSKQLFEEALVLQRQKKWDGALEVYQKILDQSSGSSSNKLNSFEAAAIYHNMSSVAYQKSDFLKAYVWSKKSLALNSSNQIVQDSFVQYSKKFEIPSIAHQITNYDNMRTILSKTPLDLWLSLSLLFIFVSIWMVLKNIIISRKNRLENNFSKLTRWPIYVFIASTFIILLLSYNRYLEAAVSRGIVITEKAQIQTAPGDNKSIIYEAQAGLELEVLKFSQGFYQVRYPGAFSGWINNTQIEVMSLDFKHEK